MSFVFSTENPKIWWPVKVSVPTDGGKFETQTLHAYFEILPKEEIDEHQKRISDQLTETGDYTLDFAQDILTRVVLNWKAVIGPDQQPIDFTQDVLRKMLGTPFIKTAFWDSYGEAASGRRRKN